MKVINICFGDSECGMLKYYLDPFTKIGSYEKDYESTINRVEKAVIDGIVTDERAVVTQIGVLCLDQGDISSENFEESRKYWIDSYFYGMCKKEVQSIFEEDLKRLENIISKAKDGYELRIWQSKAAYSACAYYFLIDKLLGIDCKVVSIGLKPSYIGFDGKEEYPICWGNVSKDNFLLAIDYVKPLTEIERTALSAEWKRLQTENAPLRIWEEDRVVSVGEDYFDKFILKCLEKMPDGEFCEARLVGTVLGTSGHHIKDSYVADRIELMIAKGLLNVTKKAGRDQPQYYQFIKRT
jgi:hypothetical protein